MADVKISNLPEVQSLSTTDIAPFVASGTTSKITLENIAASMPQVSSSISASIAATASYVEASNVVGLNLSRIASGSATASISPGLFDINTNTNVQGNLTASNALFTGNITAQTLVVQTVSSSVIYSSGSNIFGDDVTDVQQMTGSVRITGSLTVTGSLNLLGATTLLGRTNGGAAIGGQVIVNNAATSLDGGAITIIGGTSQGALSATGGSVTLYGGGWQNSISNVSYISIAGSEQYQAGTITIQGGINGVVNLVGGSGGAYGGSIYLKGGSAVYTGNVYIHTQNAGASGGDAGYSGEVNIYSGTGGVSNGATGASGNLIIYSGNAGVSLSGLTGTQANSGNVSILTGKGGGTHTGGSATGGNAGNILITSGDGGNITGGPTAIGGNAGDIIFTTGTGGTGIVNGNPGKIYFKVNTSSTIITISNDTNKVDINGTVRIQNNLTVSGSVTITGSLSVTGSATINNLTGSLFGTASWAQNVPASGVVGLNLSQISSGSVSASVNINSASFQVTSGSTNLLFVSNSGLITAQRLFLSSSRNTVSGSTLVVFGSGSAQPVFTVQGSQGELFSVNDSLSGSLFSVNDISGLPIIEAFSDNRVLIGSYQAPMLTTTVRTTLAVGNNIIYQNVPTASYDAVFFEYSLKSGSNARAGSIMGIWSGSDANYNEVVTADFGDTTGVKFMVMVTGSNIALTGSATTANWTMKTIIRSI